MGFLIFSVALAATAAALPKHILVVVVDDLGSFSAPKTYEPVGPKGPHDFPARTRARLGYLFELVGSS